MQAGDFVSGRGYVYELLLMRRLAASSTSAFPAYGDAPAAATPAPAAEEEAEEPAPVTAPEADDEDEDIEDILDEAVDEFDDWEEEEEGEFELKRGRSGMPPPKRKRKKPTTLKRCWTPKKRAKKSRRSEPVAAPAPTDEVQRGCGRRRYRRGFMGNRREQAEALSRVWRGTGTARGQDNEAISSYLDALSVHEAVNDSGGLLATLEALASLTAKTDNSQVLSWHATRGVKLAEELGSDTSHTSLLTILGDARQQLGETEEAIDALRIEALDPARTANDKPNIALGLYKLGFAQLDGGDPAAAIQSWKKR
ncbi:MAG: hypothetical protein U0703_12770 [Anaerolineae bacterium]